MGWRHSCKSVLQSSPPAGRAGEPRPPRGALALALAAAAVACALERLARSIFELHTAGVAYDRDASGAEWWAQVRDRGKQEGIEFQTVTAGDFKRTVTPTKKVTKEDLAKTEADIKEIFSLFKKWLFTSYAHFLLWVCVQNVCHCFDKSKKMPSVF